MSKNEASIETKEAKVENFLSLKIKKSQSFEYCYQSASQYFINGEFLRAQKKFFQALKIAEKNSIFSEVTIKSFLGLGKTHYYFHEYNFSLSYYQQALALLSEINDLDLAIVSELYFNICFVFFKLRKYDKAEENFLQGVEIAIKTLGSMHAQIAGIYLEISDWFKKYGLYEKYLQYQIKHYKILIHCEIKQNLFNAAGFQSKLAKCYYLNNEFDVAISAYHQALAMYHDCKLNPEDLSLTRKVTEILNNLGYIYFKLENFTMALDYHQKALKLQKIPFGEETIDSAHTHVRIGDTYERLGDLRLAIQSHKMAIDIFSFYNKGQFTRFLHAYRFRFANLQKDYDAFLASTKLCSFTKLFSALNCLNLFQLCKKNNLEKTEEKDLLHKMTR